MQRNIVVRHVAIRLSEPRPGLSSTHPTKGVGLELAEMVERFAAYMNALSVVVPAAYLCRYKSEATVSE